MHGSEFLYGYSHIKIQLVSFLEVCVIKAIIHKINIILIIPSIRIMLMLDTIILLYYSYIFIYEHSLIMT